MEDVHLLSNLRDCAENGESKVSQTSIGRQKGSLVDDLSNVKSYESIYSLSDSESGGRISTVYPTPELHTYGGIKLGWIQGVLIPCLLNIWGVMLFLRIAWVVAQAGIGLTIVIIGLSGVVCVITTLSLSAICTNGQLQGGGVYYIVSRSLGAEFGASVGIIFAFANSVAASMNTIGFCDSLNDLLKSHGLKIIDNSVNDVRIVGAIALFVMCFICAVGMDWETKAQNFLVTIIVLAITNYIIGAFIGPRSSADIAQGFVGISLETARKNWASDFRFSEKREHNFFSVFAVYFPAVTGVQAGANICGDLRDPATAIPKGTLTALAISITSYMSMALLSGFGALRDASGVTSNLSADSLATCKPHCEYGLHNNYRIMQLMALWGPLIYGGCWAATLSTALTNLLSVPRLIQALGADRIYPGLIFFSKPYGRHGEPYRGYVLTFTVSLLFLLIADLNTIAPLITNFYLASYALINFCTFHAAFVEQISWRPTFRCYNKWLSLAGFVMCVTIMMIISWLMALTTICIFITLYLLVLYRKPEAHWGSSTEGQRYQDTVTFVMQMSRRADNIKYYSPQALVLAGRPYERPELLDMAQFITKKVGSFMIVADIESEEMPYAERVGRCRLTESWLRSRKHRAFYVLLSGQEYEPGALTLMQTTGLGKLSPNMLLIGYKYKWRNCNNDDLVSYYQVIQHAFDQQLAVAILRMPDAERPPVTRKYSDAPPALDPDAPAPSKTREDNLISTDRGPPGHPDPIIIDTEQSPTEKQKEPSKVTKIAEPTTLSTNKSEKSPQLQSKRGTSFAMYRKSISHNYKRLSFDRKSCIDAWLLNDDGGLSILLPYIIANRGYKDKLPLRIFALARGQHSLEDAQKYMEGFLAKFRIEYSELTLVRGVNDSPSEDSWKLFNNTTKHFRNREKNEIRISDTELNSQHSKTSRHLRLRELLIQHSSDAALIITSLPYPRKGSASAALYMSWLEVLSQGMPPMIFLRGNESYVLDG